MATSGDSATATDRLAYEPAYPYSAANSRRRTAASPALEPQDAWRQFIRVVGPDNEAEWAGILKQARKTADQVHGVLPDSGASLAIDQYVGGHLSQLQGKAWEAYARRCLVLLDEIDRAAAGSHDCCASSRPGTGVHSGLRDRQEPDREDRRHRHLVRLGEHARP